MGIDQILSLNEPEDVLGELRGWIRAERQRFCWTQSDLARRSGVPSATISRLELTGLASTETLFKILFAMNKLDGLLEFLKERHRLADLPVTLREAPNAKPVLRVRRKRA